MFVTESVVPSVTMDEDPGALVRVMTVIAAYCVGVLVSGAA